MADAERAVQRAVEGKYYSHFERISASTIEPSDDLATVLNVFAQSAAVDDLHDEVQS